jgi:hypothetical protein
LAYQPPANNTFLSEQTSHQQPASNTFLLEQISTSHQPLAKRTGCKLRHSKSTSRRRRHCPTVVCGTLARKKRMMRRGTGKKREKKQNVNIMFTVNTNLNNM